MNSTPRDLDSDTTPPPPSPWWSRPDEDTRVDGVGGEDPWGAPSGSAGPHGTRGSNPSGQPPYGQAGYGSQAPPRETDDPWSRPTTQASFPSGAQAWGYPTDTIGVTTAPPRRSRGGAGMAAAVLATALVAGGVGGAVGARSQDSTSLLDPTASLGSTSSTSAAVDRAPDSVAGIAARVMQSTVSIAVRGAGGSGTGSGVVIRSDGYVLTNNHVVESAAGGGEITVTFDGAEQELPAQIVGLDPVTDLAVLQVRADEVLPAAALGQSRALVVGDPVIAIGSPLGLSGTVTTGIVSALNRTVNVPSQDGGANSPLFNAIQTDAAINPGNSGGALVNSSGEVIGINSAIATLGGGRGAGDAGGSIGVGFAIPIDEARSVAEEIIRTGRATHPSIGVSATTVAGEAGRQGALVRELSAGGAAAGAGLEPNDLIVAVGDVEVTSVDELILAIRANKIGDTVTLTYVRDGRSRTAEVVLQDLPRN